jgi:hypothetical protein
MNISVVAVIIVLLLGFGIAVWFILRYLNK